MPWPCGQCAWCRCYGPGVCQAWGHGLHGWVAGSGVLPASCLSWWDFLICLSQMLTWQTQELGAGRGGGSQSQPLESQPLAFSGRKGRSQGKGGKLP